MKPIDLDRPEWQDNQVRADTATFAKIQGYSIVSHGNDYVLLALLRFADRPAGQQQIRDVLAAYGAKAAGAFALYASYVHSLDNKFPKAEKVEKLYAVGISSSGFKALGLDEDRPRGLAFSDGFAPRFVPKTRRFEAVIVIALDDEDQLDVEEAALRDQFEPLGVSIQFERGAKAKKTGPKNGLKLARDHFGMPDGLSQPNWAKVPREHSHGKMKAKVPAAPEEPPVSLSHFLIEQQVFKIGQRPQKLEGEYGSFMAFVKFRVSRLAFDRLAQEMSMRTRRPTAEVKSWILGRKDDGKPLARLARGADLNDFDYNSDPKYAQCPGAAHIRKMNPRSHDPVTGASNVPRILRRSVNYGGPDDNDQGLLFQCFQSKIETAFETLFGSWARREHVPEPGGGRDALICAHAPWPVPAGVPAPNPPVETDQLSTVVEGEYFYFPSILYFERLSPGLGAAQVRGPSGN